MQKRILAIALSSWVMLAATPTNEFRKGWYDGYPAGYKDVCKKVMWVPQAPYPPNPSLDRASYNHGYAAGFKKGREDARKRCN